MIEASEFGLPAPTFDRRDDSDDLGFCARLSLVTLSNKVAVAALTSSIVAGGQVLDLVSIW